MAPGHHDRSRAMYGLDLMIDHEGPKITEISYAPDCTRAEEYYPGFFNSVFDVLFRGEEVSCFERL